MLNNTYLFEGQGKEVEDMDASNPLSIMQAASPSLATVRSPSAQVGAITTPATKAPEVPPALMPPAALQYQFNIQQSLLMQQYALAQQAAVKAATVKSAAEVAAARAAEISKQLEKKSQSSATSKSISGSPSRPKSKSRSRSLSHSPIRKRRARSYSRSPIRYRRDYHSSYRPREHYGYRGYNYRSYYRGSYNDYSRYRYDRDHYRRRSRSRGRRRSRTRSRSRSPRRDRSRGRRRSQSLSPPAKNRSLTRSPQVLRKKSVSPHARRDGIKSRHNPLRSESREAERSPSLSSRSITSPPAKSRSRSSSQVKTRNEDQSPSTELSHEMDEDRLAFVDRKPGRESSVSSHGRMQSSSSTAKSLSVSLEDQSNRSAPDKVATKLRTPDEPGETVKALSSDDDEETSKRTSSDELVSPGERNHGKVDELEGWNKISGGGRRIRKPMRSPNAVFHDESEGSDETLDDWRDDLKQVVKGKGFSIHKDGEPDRPEGRSRSGMDSFVKSIAIEEEPKHESILQGASPGHGDPAIAVGEQDVMTYQGYGPAVVRGEEESLHGESRQVSVLENSEEVCDEGANFEQVVDENIIFEGPKPASPVCEQNVQRYEAGGTEIDGHFIDEKSPSANRSAFEKKAAGRIVEDDKCHTKDLDRRHSHEKKVKDRSKSRDDKKYEGELTKHEKRRDRHKKHRRKHKYVEEENAERDEARRRHKRKHKREEEHGNKEKKKRKHKHRTRSSSVSVEGSSSDSEGEIRSRKRRKRGSKRHKAARRDVLESPHLSASLG